MRRSSPLSIIVIGAVVIAAGMAISLDGAYSVFGVHFWTPPEAHQRVWIIPTDFWWAVRGAAYVANGALGYIYEAAHPYYGLPLFPILLAPFVWLGELVGLTSGAVTPGLIPQPQIWLVLGPVLLAAVIPLLVASHRLQLTLGVTATTATDVWFVVLVFGPALWPGGHIEDVLALAFVMFALADGLEGHSVRGPFLFSLALATKQWAAIGLPLYLVLLPPRNRVRAFVMAVALPAALAAFVLLVDYPDARYSLMQAKGFVVHGRAAPFAVKLGGPYVITSPFRLATLLAGALVAFALRNRLTLERIAAAFAICFLIRFIIEPTPPAYYLSPCLAFLLIDERVRDRRNIWVPVIGLSVMLAFALPGSAFWWSFVVTAAIAAATPAATRLLTAPPSTRVLETSTAPSASSVDS